MKFNFIKNPLPPFGKLPGFKRIAGIVTIQILITEKADSLHFRLFFNVL